MSLPDLTEFSVHIKAEELLEIVNDSRLRTRSDNNASMDRILEWLWDTAIEPVLEKLGFREMPERDAAWPHVWWIPIGRLSLFPIHAAGYHSVPSWNTLDRVISSYTPTVRALDHARNQIQNRPQTSSQTALLVNMPTTPNRQSLTFAAKEVNAINTLLPQSVARMMLHNPTKSEVLERIGQSSIVHFACHGEANLDPSKSRILLSDWEVNPFSVADMTQIALNQVELAYISACHAASNRDVKLLDESIHIGGAFQLAGLPSVIATLWGIDDEYSARVAEYVYRIMLTDDKRSDVRQAASGLHFALRDIRGELWKKSRSQTSNPLTWASYIYVGV